MQARKEEYLNLSFERNIDLDNTTPNLFTEKKQLIDFFLVGFPFY
ncbi:hypothetical protein [Flavobacterium sp. I-STPP5a]|nr:hypothetical protein [Flavobacterium sp. I-STPP5a]